MGLEGNLENLEETTKKKIEENSFNGFSLETLVDKLKSTVTSKLGIKDFYVHVEDVGGAGEDVEDLEMKDFMKHNKEEREILEAIQTKVGHENIDALPHDVKKIIPFLRKVPPDVEGLEKAILEEAA